ncbi:MAG: ComF family protein [Pseudomonadota bacterium]
MDQLVVARRPVDWRHWARVLPRAVLRAVLPSACAVCGGASDAPVCDACRLRYTAPSTARCPRCANPVAPADALLACGVCQARQPHFDATLAAVDYTMPLDQLVLQLKFGGQLALAPWCARTMVDALLARPQFALPELLCPVPLGPLRLRERGFNQALEIARPLARALGIALLPGLLLRTRETKAQSSLAPAQRAANIRRAFVLAPGCEVRDRHVGVVDDVMTSGRTLDELAATLKRFGAARVSNLVFARTPPH